MTLQLTDPESRLIEAFDALWDDVVDPREAYADSDGWWRPVGTTNGAARQSASPVSEQSLANLRAQCRTLAATNEFAINGHENRISYIVGPGHIYRAAVCKGITPVGMGDSLDLAMQVQKLLDEFSSENRWHQRQQEIVRRIDRDGEAFLRFFTDRDGLTRVRFIEPDQVVTPTTLAGDASASFGIQTEPDDVESVLGYYIDGDFVEARDIQHRRANVDFNVKRGLSRRSAKTSAAPSACSAT
jgi:capsid protein